MVRFTHQAVPQAAAVLLTLIGVPVLAQTPAIPIPADLPIPRVDGPFVTDGVLDEPGWDQAHRLTLDFEIRPGENTPPPVETEVWIGEDGQGLVVAFIAHDPDPDSIRAFYRDRDAAYDDDSVGIVLDTFNDQRRAVQFYANPFGAQMDLIYDDVNGDESDNWNAIWDSGGRITDGGYVVEMYIPYRALNFDDSGDELVWGIDLIRRYPRDFNTRFASSPRDRNISCYLCQLRKARGMAGVEPGRNLELTPVLVVTGGESTEDPLTQPLESKDIEVEPGLDLRWGITPETTLNATLNPDFSQVEADVPQLDVNNNFALFFPEARPFFLEGEDTYTTPMTLIYTRNIVDPDYGLKVTGKSGPNTFGLFTTDDTVTNFIIPGSQGSDFATLDDTGYSLAGRYRRDVGELNSTVGAVFTGRRSGDYENAVTGIDGRWQITGSDRIIAQIVASQTQYDPQTVEDFEQPEGSFSDLAGQITYSHVERDWTAFARYADFGTDFRADLGFIPQVDYRYVGGGGSYRWYPEEGDPNPWFQQIQIYSDYDLTRDQSGQLLEEEVDVSAWIQSLYQSYVEVGTSVRDTFFNGTLYEEDLVFIYGEAEPVRGFAFDLYWEQGQAVDFANERPADSRGWEAGVRWNIGPHLLLRVSQEQSILETLTGEEIFDARLTDFRATWQFSIRSFLRLTSQYQDITRNPDVYVDEVDETERALAWQLLYSWKLNPQTVFFAGVSEAGFEDDRLGSLEVFDRSAFVKASYAWFP